MEQHQNRICEGFPRTAAFRIAGVYLLFALAWIAASDFLLHALNLPRAVEQGFQTYKGIGFVTTTAFVLWWICDRRFQQMAATHRRLEEKQRMFDTLVGNLPGVAYRCLANVDWAVLFISDGFEPLTGYSRGDLDAGRITYNQIIHADDREQVRVAVEKAIRIRGRYRLEYRIVRHDGQVRWVWEQGQPVFDEDGRLTTLEGFISDITDRKRAEQLSQQRNSFEQSRRAMEQSLGVVGHELRTPLASLRAISEYLLDEDEPNNPQQSQQLLRGLNDQVIRMTDMVNNMLEAARLNSGSAAWRWSAVNVGRVARDAMEVIRPLVDERHVQLDVQVHRKPLMMSGDADALRRLLLNLLSNAARFTRAGKITVTATEVETDGRRWIRLQVMDTGNGIPAEKVAKLGMAFALNDGSVQEASPGGTGLGLAICKQIAAAHGGGITMRSVTGGSNTGTVFTIQMPADLEEPQTGENPDPITTITAG
ncbi:MAG: HAMP domain-containing sensor histidine kinase [Phycisphaeraceae bacterium]